MSGPFFRELFFAPHFSTAIILGISLVDGTVRAIGPVKDLSVLLRAYF